MMLISALTVRLKALALSSRPMALALALALKVQAFALASRVETLALIFQPCPHHCQKVYDCCTQNIQIHKSRVSVNQLDGQISQSVILNSGQVCYL